MKDPNKKKTYHLSFVFNAATVALISLLGLMAAIIILFSALYGANGQIVYLILMFVLMALLLGGFITLIIMMARRLRQYYKDGLYQVTANNYKRINEGNTDLEKYPIGRIEEFKDLNRSVDQISATLRNVTFVYSSLDYESFDLKKVDEFDNVVMYDSFQKQLTNIIAASMSFRNAVAEIYYEIGDDRLSKEEIEKIIKEIRKRFAGFSNILIILPEDFKSIYIYIPTVDSFASVEEKFGLLMPSIAINKHTLEGFAALPAHYSIVCYPFSAVRDLLSDLRYAKRQGKLANLYLPNRLHDIGSAKIGRNAMQLNQMSKILFNFAKIETDQTNKQEVRKGLSEVLNALCHELDFETAGIVAYGQEEGGFMVLDQVGAQKPFTIGERVEDDIARLLREIEDPDHSFYFSKRDLLPSRFGRVCDRLHITSGFFYTIIRDKKIIGFIYFVNSEGEARLDSYLQEALSALCYHISDSFVKGRIIEEMVESHRLVDAILYANEEATYQVDRSTYNLMGTSENFKHVFGKSVNLGEKCHKVLYGFNTPCRDCPLLTGNKQAVTQKNKNFATSMTLDTKRGNICTMFLKRRQSEEETLDRYDHELLINSFFGLFEEAKKHYQVGDNGYVLLLQMDNHASLLEKYGSEGLMLIYRNFLEKLKQSINASEQLYSFDPQTFALLLPNVGQVDVLNKCEEIFTYTKHLTYQNDDVYDLQVTYRPMNYPQGYPGANDFFRHVYRELSDHKRIKRNLDMVYFDDTDYVRPASRREFMLSVIEEQFGKETFRVSLQPMVRGTSKKIYGAEILLRIQDEYRHIVFNPDELVHVAEVNGKIPLITRALLRYVSNFYQSVSAKALDDLGFSRISLNTEVSLFTDSSFEEDFTKFLKENRFPNQFLSFEIPEKDASERMEEFKRISKFLSDHDAEVVIDQYSGRFLSLDELVRLGVHHIKVSRGVVINIDSDQRKLADIKLLLEEAKAKGIHATVVGVENVDQYQLLMGIDSKINLQGYFFYRPLERDALVEALRNNRFIQDK